MVVAEVDGGLAVRGASALEFPAGLRLSRQQVAWGAAGSFTSGDRAVVSCTDRNFLCHLPPLCPGGEDPLPQIPQDLRSS